MKNKILNILKETTDEKGYKNHPVMDCDFETKIYYLHGLALVMNVDCDIHSKEKKYLMKLIKTFGVNVDEMENLIGFGKNPNKKIIEEMLEVLKKSGISKNFMIDCYEMAYRDKKIKIEEKEIIKEYIELLNIENSTDKYIRYSLNWIHRPVNNNKFTKNNEIIFSHLLYL